MRRHYRVRLALALTAALAVHLVPSPGTGYPTTFAAESSRDLAQAPPESVGVSADRLRRLNAGLKRYVDEGRIAGLVQLLARHGKIVHFTTAGKKDVSASEPIQKDSIFRIYSMTKPVTGVAMMMLYEEGKWRLDDPVSRFVPEFANLKVHAGQNPDGTAKLEDARRGMTMRELMTHSAGLAYGLGNVNPVDRMYRETRVLDNTRPLSEMIQGLGKLPLLAQPGTRWAYSIAVDVQGHIVEKLSGQTLGDFFQTRIFQPLGMKDTGFYVPKEKIARLAKVHSDGQEGKLQGPEDRGDATVPPKGPSGGGGLFSTAEDYARFCQMLLDGGQFNGTRLLAPRTVEMMRTNHLSKEATATMQAGRGFGLDVAVVMDSPAAGEASPEGSYYWLGIAGTWFWIDPKTDLFFVGMMQHQQGRTTGEIQGLSRNLVYQAVLN
jgi:CubicO group peptidase (beta-lactamase class C family)